MAAFYTHPHSGGKLAVLGSPTMFSDAYVDKEDNFKIFQLIYKVRMKDNEDPEFSLFFVPD